MIKIIIDIEPKKRHIEMNGVQLAKKHERYFNAFNSCLAFLKILELSKWPEIQVYWSLSIKILESDSLKITDVSLKEQTKKIYWLEEALGALSASIFYSLYLRNIAIGVSKKTHNHSRNGNYTSKLLRNFKCNALFNEFEDYCRHN